MNEAGIRGSLPGRDPPLGWWFFTPFFALSSWFVLLLWFSLPNHSPVSLPSVAFFLLICWLENIWLIKHYRHWQQQKNSLHQLVQQLTRERELQALELSSHWQTASTLETLGYYAAAVLHNLSGPLSTINNIVTEISPQLSNRQRRDIEACLGYACNTIRHARDHLKNEPVKPTNINISAAFGEVQHVVHHLLVKQKVVLRLFCPVELEWRGDLTLLRQVLLNLIQNSLEALAYRDDGQIVMRAIRQKSNVVITIRDNGQGMKGTQLKRLGQRFYTQKRGGTGLGVAFVQETVRQNFGGECRYESRFNNGTTVTLILPLPK